MKIIKILPSDYPANLKDDDLCYHFLYYTKEGYAYSEANSIVLNFKKPVIYKEQKHWDYKIKAIKYFANLINNAITIKQPITIIPCATSNPRKSENFDNRLDEVANELSKLNPSLYDAQFCLDTIYPQKPVHSGGVRDAEVIKSVTTFIMPKTTPHNNIILIDDVFTTGAHFRAYKDIIQAKYPNHQIIGVFLARYQNN